jgi:hypothetical protein
MSDIRLGGSTVIQFAGTLGFFSIGRRATRARVRLGVYDDLNKPQRLAFSTALPTFVMRRLDFSRMIIALVE